MRKVPRVLWSYRNILLKPVNGPTKMSMSGCSRSLCTTGRIVRIEGCTKVLRNIFIRFELYFYNNVIEYYYFRNVLHSKS